MKLFVVVAVVCFCFGRAGGQSALELGVKLFVAVAVVVLSVFVLGRAGGQSALELGVKLFVAVAVVVLSVFVLGRAGGQSASGAVKGEGGPVSFGVGCETVRRRRRRAVCFCFGGGRGRVSFRGCEGEGGPVSFGVWCETVRRRRRRAVCFCFGAGGGRAVTCCLFLFWGGTGAGGQSALEFGGVVVGFFRKGFCQEEFCQGFCQAGILPGSGLCQEAGSARKESQLWSCALSSFGGNGVKIGS